METDQCCCAHQKVSYRTREAEPGHIVEAWWECDSGCGQRFTFTDHPDAAPPTRNIIEAYLRCVAPPPIDTGEVAEAIELEDAVDAGILGPPSDAAPQWHESHESHDVEDADTVTPKDTP